MARSTRNRAKEIADFCGFSERKAYYLLRLEKAAALLGEADEWQTRLMAGTITPEYKRGLLARAGMVKPKQPLNERIRREFRRFLGQFDPEEIMPLIDFLVEDSLDALEEHFQRR